MDRWLIYGLLKGCRIETMTEADIEQAIKRVSAEELQEGVIEYLLVKKREIWTS